MHTALISVAYTVSNNSLSSSFLSFFHCADCLESEHATFHMLCESLCFPRFTKFKFVREWGLGVQGRMGDLKRNSVFSFDLGELDIEKAENGRRGRRRRRGGMYLGAGLVFLRGQCELAFYRPPQ
ncbi:hypothetical protein NA56DRAFT_87912 [Hyaloscypha hepaticicola]|uniref:Uncharacterized protein n=1 Tax=Hyaloscypha hepaticicola TaxID=2082293 RepID=A0A2J6Q863_9HELO|nr:hypothetical protein NA56DRAFT_87912 [Hyaloscypha hepaticicola]